MNGRLHIFDNPQQGYTGEQLALPLPERELTPAIVERFKRLGDNRPSLRAWIERAQHEVRGGGHA